MFRNLVRSPALVIEAAAELDRAKRSAPCDLRNAKKVVADLQAAMKEPRSGVDALDVGSFMYRISQKRGLGLVTIDDAYVALSKETEAVAAICDDGRDPGALEQALRFLIELHDYALTQMCQRRAPFIFACVA